LGKTKVLFLCHGNICRSVMAEYMMKDMVRKTGREAEFEIDSAALTTEEIGNPIYPPARRKLAEKGVPIGEHRARLAEAEDAKHFDLLIGMDDENMRMMKTLSQRAGVDFGEKCFRLTEFAGKGGSISDPWYTRDFESCYRDIQEGLEGLLKKV